MPIRYKAEHFEFPKDLNLEVFKELPEGFEDRSFYFGPKQAWNRLRDNKGRVQDLRIMTFCQHCEGWIPAEPHQHRIDNLDGSRLCGRRGEEYYCARCAQEIHFSGMMS